MLDNLQSVDPEGGFSEVKESAFCPRFWRVSFVDPKDLELQAPVPSHLECIW